MDGLAAIGSRIAEINAQLSQLSAPSVRPAATASRAGAVTAAGATSGTTTGAGSTGGSAAPSFADVLAGAVHAGAAGSTTASATATTGAAGTAATTTARTSTTTGSAVPALGTSGAITSTAGVAPVTAGSPRATTGTTPTATTSTTTSTGRLTRTGAPAELAHYGNGRIPASALESIGGGHRLWAPAAEAFQRLRSAAHRSGVDIGVTDSYRSYADQVDVARRKGLHSQGGLAAKPGTSEHGWGKSLDLRLDASAQRWMRRHADEYGFTENVSREPWHWTYAAR
jgi:zinc D-Ala-D-Ala carboxypeptidase